MSEVPLAGGDVDVGEMWDAGSGVEIQARSAWIEGQRDDLLAFLR